MLTVLHKKNYLHKKKEEERVLTPEQLEQIRIIVREEIAKEKACFAGWVLQNMKDLSPIGVNPGSQILHESEGTFDTQLAS